MAELGGALADARIAGCAPRRVKPYEPGAVSAIRDGRCACTKRPR